MLAGRKKEKEKLPQLQHYQLGQELGRGGFGAVFSALNLQTGEIVAIKQVSLTNVDAEDMGAIEMEISLLKKLNHPNIVKYIDTIRDADNLHIVLEFMENGSLQQVVKKFGNFSESLVGLYIAQVLNGLAYLHEQGVLHRDIKGANILTAKDGHVKLGDFGVAIALSDNTETDCAVVGTPYWMAPEIIEMTTPTAACDIWSVGCTIVELLSGRPPYFELAPMAALFRIVQDDYPPLPEGISPALRDFLFQCFTKDPRLRKSAPELLRHPWLRNNQVSRVHDESRVLVEAAPHADERDREGIISTIRLYTGTLNAEMAAAAAAAAAGDDATQPPRTPRGGGGGGPAAGAAPALTPAGGEAGEDGKQVDEDEEEEEDWDDDIEEPPTTPTASPTERRLSNADQSVQAQMRALQGARPAAQEPQTKTSAKEAKEVKALLQDDLEDDNLFWDDSDDEDGMAQQLQRVSGSNSRVLSATGSGGAGSGTAPDMLTKGNTSARLNRFMEDDDDDDFGDMELEATPGGGPASTPPPLALNLKQTSIEDGEAGGFEDQVFDELDFEGSADRDVVARKLAKVLKLLELLVPTAEASTILEACEDLIDIFHEYPSTRQRLVTQHGVVPIMEMLEVSNPSVLHALLRVVNQVVENDKKVQENLSLAGVMPIMVRLARTESQHDDILLEAGKFVQQVCSTSTLTLQMFIACGGLHVLLHFLEVTGEGQTNTIDKQLMWTAIDGITRAFTLTTIPKNDFCRLFLKGKHGGLLNHLMGSFAQIMKLIEIAEGTEGTEAAAEATRLWDYAAQVSEIISHFSRGDHVVKAHLCEPTVLQALMRRLNPPDAEQKMSGPKLSELVVGLLRIVKNLSMEPACLDALEAAGAIPTLVKLLGLRGPRARDIHNHGINAMFYMCRISKVRQEQAALCGLVPHLQDCISTRSPLRQFALPVFCDLAHASHSARERLWVHGGVQSYLDLLSEGYWQSKALDSLATWVTSDYGGKVVGVLLQPENLTRIIGLFRTAQKGEFEALLEPMFELVAKSVPLNQAFGRSGQFMESLVERLQYPKAIVRRHLLRILKEVLKQSGDKHALLLEHNLFPVVSRIARDATMVVVMELALQLEEDFNALAPWAGEGPISVA